ncbi:MAG: hypothetical protein JSS75_00250 [Bacteroidetes bacterium]|nr:hypothetical protein [Bacteroidota bacterium]
MLTTLRSVLLLPAALLLLVVTGATPAAAQGPRGNDFGFGIVLGEPLGGTVKYWTAPDQAFVGSIGGSYFGAPRVGVDYLWHFDAFRSQVVKMYAGPGLAVGFGNGSYYWLYTKHGDYFYVRDPGSTGFAMRVVVGLNIIPRRTPIELFLEAGPLIGISPAFGAAFDLGLGIRFYP